jgi:hypothetical protein
VKIRFFILFFWLSITLVSDAQRMLTLHFVPTFNAAPLALDSTYSLDHNHSIRFEMLKFYISNLKMFHREKLVFEAENAFLLDYANPSSFDLTISLDSTVESDEIEFQLGIDSLTNHSGALGGNLDPTLGMYWTWQNGYINLKLEGKSTLSSSPKNNFEFHIGGYMHPFETIQTIRLKGDFSKHKTIQLDLDSLFNQLDLSTVHHIMSPGNEAVAFANLIKSMFKLMP